MRNPRAYEHTYLGIATGEGGAVFKALRIKPIAKEDRLRFELKPNIGMDFGYVDPNAIEKTYYEAGELRTLYIYEEVYQNEMTTKQIAAACRKIARHGELIRADNAAKQVIVDLRTDYGINITGVTKGKNSRQAGYDWLRDLDQIVIDPITCPNAAREFAAYEYARDKGGTLVERYPDGDDHSIDAVAYGNREHIYGSRRTSNVSGKGARTLMQPYQTWTARTGSSRSLPDCSDEQVTRDIDEIIRLYSLYDGDGQRWQVNTNGLDYTPTVKVTNIIAELIGKEARYMMGVEPELRIVPKEKDNQAAQANADVIGSWLTALLEEQKWSKKLLDAAKDCFIGKRVALKLTGKRGGRLGIQFRPSLEFVYDTDPEDVDRLTKVIFFYHTNESTGQAQAAHTGGRSTSCGPDVCYLTEGLYDGTGRTISEYPQRRRTRGLTSSRSMSSSTTV